MGQTVSCGFLRQSAPPKCCNSQQTQRKSAKISENLRKTANLAPFVPFSLSLLIPLDLQDPMPGSRASSRSLRLRPWTTICFVAPSSKFLDLLPPAPLRPVQELTQPQLGPFFLLKFVRSRVLGRDFFNRFQSP